MEPSLARVPHDSRILFGKVFLDSVLQRSGVRCQGRRHGKGTQYSPKETTHSDESRNPECWQEPKAARQCDGAFSSARHLWTPFCNGVGSTGRAGDTAKAIQYSLKKATHSDESRNPECWYRRDASTACIEVTNRATTRVRERSLFLPTCPRLRRIGTAPLLARLVSQFN